MPTLQDQLKAKAAKLAGTAQKQAVNKQVKPENKNGKSLSIPDGIVNDDFITTFRPIESNGEVTCLYVSIQRNQFNGARGKNIQAMSTKTLRQLSVLFSGSETFENPHFEKLVTNTEKLNESLSS